MNNGAQTNGTEVNGTERETAAQIFESYRPLLFSIAYRMVGRVMEAEDMVQEAYLRYLAVDPETVQSHKAFLTTIVTRLCLDHLKSARVQREEYVGPWLPEPLITEDSPARRLDQKESITMAFLVLLEKLSPVERAVFLLREVFDYDYAAIASIVEKSEANCRQLYSRAKRHLLAQRPRFAASQDEQRALIDGFLRAISTGDEETLVTLLADDVQLWSDGGGKVTAARRPLFGRDRVVRFLFGIYNKRPSDMHVALRETNGTQSLLIYVDGQVFGVMNFSVADGKIQEIRTVLNPDKLRHLQSESGDRD